MLAWCLPGALGWYLVVASYALKVVWRCSAFLLRLITDIALVLICWPGVTLTDESVLTVLNAVDSSVEKDMMTWFALILVCGGAGLVSDELK